MRKTGQDLEQLKSYSHTSDNYIIIYESLHCNQISSLEDMLCVSEAKTRDATGILTLFAYSYILLYLCILMMLVMRQSLAR